MQGTVTDWRGTYGFIDSDDGRRVLVHYSAIAGDGYRALEPGVRVEFESRETPRGPSAYAVFQMDDVSDD